jgi:hypothetical protein
MKVLKKSIWKVLNLLRLGGSVNLFLRSALSQEGWFRSYHSKQSVDAQGAPLPWCTYPFLDFLKGRLQSHWLVFEYGSGNSTRWFAPRVGQVYAAEHHAEWLQKVQPLLPANAQVLACTEYNYAESILRSGQGFHLVLIDGILREDCARFALQALQEDGVIVLDNSDRADYQSIFHLLQKEGFKHIDFWGMCPIIAAKSCTTVFYRSHNCLSI